MTEVLNSIAFSRITVPVKSMYRMVGTRILLMFLATIPVGLALGAVEILIAFAFYLVLARFHLVSTKTMPEWLPEYINPVALLIVVMFGSTLLRYVSQTLPNLSQSAFHTRLRTAMAEAALDRPGEGGDVSVASASHLSGTVASKAGGFVQGLTSTVSAMSLVILIGTQLVAISWKLTAFSFLGTIILGVPILLLKPIYGRYTDRQYKFLQEFNFRFLKDVRNSHFLKICGLAGSEAAELARISKNTYVNTRTSAYINSIIVNFPPFAGVLLIIALLLANEKWSLVEAASLVPFVYLLNRAIGSLVAISSSQGVTRECLPYIVELARYEKYLFPEKIISASGTNPVTELSTLEIRNLLFGRNTPLTEALSFSVKQGDMLLISGPSGRGKTTLLMTFLGLVSPLGGAVIWNGMNVEDINATELRQKVAFAGAEPYLIDADIRTNVLFGLDRGDVSDGEIHHALQIACAEFVFDFKEGLAYPLREHGDGISAGQKQRLALARCILRRPELLILDEATSNLDEENERLFFSRLLAAYPMMTIIAVSHRTSLRAFANHFVTI